MKIPDLDKMIISISDFKTQMSDIISKGLIKVIMKNNKLTSVILPYEAYTDLTKNITDKQRVVHKMGRDILLSNGVNILVSAETNMEGNSEVLEIKTYVKMKTSGDYKLHHTLTLNSPQAEEALTIEEQIKQHNLLFTEQNSQQPIV